MSIRLTRHAQARSQQRGIPPMLVDLLLNYGTAAQQDKGITTYYFDHAARRRVRSYAGPLAGLLEQHLDCYLLAEPDGAIVTIGHRYKRRKH